jgi:hypothetical protein
MSEKPNRKNAQRRREMKKAERTRRKRGDRKHKGQILDTRKPHSVGDRTLDSLANRHLHPSMTYMSKYVTAEQIFGRPMTAAELIDRIQAYSWKGSIDRLADLAAAVANTPDGHQSEVIKKRTIDPLLELTAQPESASLLKQSRTFVMSNRDSILLAHEEAISFLQHLVLLRGADDGVAPADSEISLWLAGANGHLSHWNADPWQRSSELDRLMAEMVRIGRFNNHPDDLRELVRTYLIFGIAPPRGKLAQQNAWADLQKAAFGNLGFEEFFEGVLGPLYMLSSQFWGVTNGPFRLSRIHLREFFSQTSMRKDEAIALLKSMSGTRADLQHQMQTGKQLQENGLPLAPIALRHTPFVEVEPDVIVGSSPGAVLTQLRTGLWSRYRSASKRIDPKNGAITWSSSFGDMVEYWCRRVAQEVQRVRPSAGIMLSESAGSPDEVEDVVVVEGDAVVLFSRECGA